MNVDQASGQKAGAKPHGRRGFAQTQARKRRNFGDGEDGLYTGGTQEMQKGSGRWAVVSGQC